MDARGDNNEVSTTQKNAQMDDRLQQLKTSLNGWKEFLLVAQNVFLWKEMYYSYVIAGSVTFLFSLWWWMDVSVLTTVAAILFLIATADYCLPGLMKRLQGDKPWEGIQEEQYQMVCQQLLDVQDNLTEHWTFVQTKKTTNSKTYMACVTGILFFLGLIGYSINNTFLIGLLALGLCLFPGAHHNGFIRRYYGKVCQQIQAVMAKTSKPKHE